jgi:hypothetical protein
METKNMLLGLIAIILLGAFVGYGLGAGQPDAGAVVSEGAAAVLSETPPKETETVPQTQIPVSQDEQTVQETPPIQQELEPTAPAQEPETEPGVPIIEPGPSLGEIKSSLSISARTDKYSYYSREIMTLSVDVSSAHNIEGTRIRVAGIKNTYDSDKLKFAELSDISIGENNFEWAYTVPSCYGCSGLKPGEYGITAWVELGDERLAETSLTIEIAGN